MSIDLFYFVTNPLYINFNLLSLWIEYSHCFVLLCFFMVISCTPSEFMCYFLLLGQPSTDAVKYMGMTKRWQALYKTQQNAKRVHIICDPSC